MRYHAESGWPCLSPTVNRRLSFASNAQGQGVAVTAFESTQTGGCATTHDIHENMPTLHKRAKGRTGLRTGQSSSPKLAGSCCAHLFKLEGLGARVLAAQRWRMLQEGCRSIATHASAGAPSTSSAWICQCCPATASHTDVRRLHWFSTPLVGACLR